MLLPQGVCTCYHCFNGMIFSWKVYIPYPCSNISWSVMPSLTTLFKIATPFPSTYSSSPYWLFLCSSYCHLIYYVFIFSLLSFRPDLRAKILSVLFPYILSVLEHYLLHSKCSINICWANEWKLRELSNLFRDKKTALHLKIRKHRISIVGTEIIISYMRRMVGSSIPCF